MLASDACGETLIFDRLRTDCDRPLRDASLAAQDMEYRLTSMEAEVEAEVKRIVPNYVRYVRTLVMCPRPRTSY